MAAALFFVTSIAGWIHQQAETARAIVRPCGANTAAKSYQQRTARSCATVATAAAAAAVQCSGCQRCFSSTRTIPK